MTNTIVPSIYCLSNKLIATFERLCSETRPCYGVEEDMKKLKVMLLNIEAVLQDAEERSVRDESVYLWLMELKDVVFVLDDVFDEYEYDLLQHQVMMKNEKVDDFVSSSQKKLRSVVCTVDDDDDDDDARNENEYELSPYAVKDAKRKREFDNEDSSNSKSAHKKFKIIASYDNDMSEIYKHEEPESEMKNRVASSKRKREEDAEKVCAIVSTFTKLSIRHGMADRISNNASKLSKITEHMHVLQLREEHRIRENDNSTSSHENVSRVFGRELDKKKMTELLFSDCRNNVNVISIVGMKGVGKRTLAQLVYNDEIVSKYFNLKGWVHVLESYDVLQLIKAIIESFGRKLTNSKELNSLQEILKQEMWRKRVLLVLNNVCNYKNSLLEFLSTSFTGAESMRIIVTSSNDLVPEFEEMIIPYNLHSLPEDESWSLFQHCTLDCHGFHQIRRKIVSKCKGLPLSLKMLGHLLRHETDEAKWIEILESALWDETESSLEGLTAVKLSYQHLPIYLKPCLTYCSLFPKGCKFTRDKLIMLWMTQAFIQPKNNEAMEDIGSHYFNELSRRSFFEKVDNDDDDDDQLFSMHDLIHETIRTGNISNEVQHLHVRGNTFSNEHEYLNLQTVTVDEKACNISPALLDFNLLKNLRVLELKSCQLFELPDFIGNLKHLRYLHLECNQIKRLPESVSQLYNLQVLNLHHCVLLEELPKRIGNLINLQFFSCCGSQVQTLPQSIIQLHNLQTLNLLHCRNLVQLPKGIGKLKNLQHLKLEQLRLSRDMNQCGIAELKHLVNLRGKLCISGLKTVTNLEDVKEANLWSKKHIKELRFDWNGLDHQYNDSESSFEELQESVLDSLKPHTNLTKLEILNYNGAKFPAWLADPSFSNLTTIILIQCLNGKSEFLPPLGKLPSLKSLDIQKIHSIRSIGQDIFRSLVELKLCHLYGFDTWNGDFPMLRYLTIENCPKLKQLPTFPSLSSLNLWGLDQLNTIINLHDFVSLERLTVKYCPELWLSPIAQADQLPSSLAQSRGIEISGCPGLHEWCCKHRVLKWISSQEEMVFESMFVNETLF